MYYCHAWFENKVMGGQIQIFRLISDRLMWKCSNSFVSLSTSEHLISVEVWGPGYLRNIEMCARDIKKFSNPKLKSHILHSSILHLEISTMALHDIKLRSHLSKNILLSSVIFSHFRSLSIRKGACAEIFWLGSENQLTR